MESISAVSNTSIPFTHIIRATHTGSRISVPVSSFTGIYARFKHITGIPSFSGTDMVPVSKLKQLDILIEQLSRIRNRDMDVEISDIKSTGIDEMIEKYSEKLQTSLSSSGMYFPGIYEPGSILNLTA